MLILIKVVLKSWNKSIFVAERIFITQPQEAYPATGKESGLFSAHKADRCSFANLISKKALLISIKVVLQSWNNSIFVAERIFITQPQEDYPRK